MKCTGDSEYVKWTRYGKINDRPKGLRLILYNELWEGMRGQPPAFINNILLAFPELDENDPVSIKPYESSNGLPNVFSPLHLVAASLTSAHVYPLWTWMSFRRLSLMRIWKGFWTLLLVSLIVSVWSADPISHQGSAKLAGLTHPIFASPPTSKSIQHSSTLH